jgi:OOP family OmpA-OmpF porin
MKKINFTFLFMLSAFFIFAQESVENELSTSNDNKKDKEKIQKYQDDYSNWSLSLNFGSTFMSGDLKSFNGFESYDYDFDINGGLEFAGGLSLTYMVNSWWGARVSSVYGRTSSIRVLGPDQNYSSETFILNTDLSIVFNPITAFRIWDDGEPKKWGLLIMAGMGFNLSQPARYNNNEIEDIAVLDDKTYHTPGYLHVNPEIKYNLSESFDIDAGVKITYHYDSDWIDGFNHQFMGTNGNSNDVLSYFYLGATYNFGKKGKRQSLAFTSPLSHIYSIVKDVESKMDQLTTDSDGDGVPDYFDKDPETPEGVAVDGAGRPLDVDMDGIPDYMDADPFTNPGAKVDREGRELDFDGDGVPDSQDLEPNTPKGALVDVRGREIKLSQGNVGDAFLPQIYFAFNSATVTAANRERIATIARVLQNNESLTMDLIGHTDKVGSEEYNKKLGDRRAQAVKDYLVKNFDIVHLV